MAAPIKISFLADVGRAQKDVKNLGDTLTESGKAAEKSGGGVSKGLDRIGSAAVGMNAAVDAASSALAGIDAIQNGARNEAARLARAQTDVKQAMNDGEQAAVDLRQATEDLKQAQIDGKQAAVDIEQAQIDSKQANLDTAVAQKEYNAAVKEFGPNSVEARQAGIDLAQAQSDQKQAAVDLTQAQADQRQSQIDASQAQVDGKQAAVDAKTATLDLADAQRAVNPGPIQQAMHAVEMYAPVLAAATIAAQGLAAANLRTTATAIASRVATVAGTVATVAATAAQWLLNVALSANPIGLVILAVVGLVAAIVIAYKKSETFRRIVDGAFRAVTSAASAAWNWIKSHWSTIFTILIGPVGNAVRWIVQNWGTIVATAKALPGRIRAAIGNLGGLLIGAGRSVVQGFINGITGMFSAVRARLSQLTNLLPSWKGPASRDRKLLFDNGQYVIGGFLAGLESQYGQVGSSLGRFTKGLSVSAGVSGTVRVEQSAPGWARELAALLTAGLTIRLESSGTRGDDAVLELIKDRITVKGGKASILGITS
jgi:F0F1-type ATP synthase assembly protein I